MMADGKLPTTLVFQIIWLDWDESELGWDEVRAHDLTEAIGIAQKRWSAGSGMSAAAHGVFVRRKEDA